MPWTPLSGRLSNLPLVLAGPLLRRVEPDSVTVWVALREARKVTLRVYPGNQSGAAVQTGTRSTIPLGNALHVVAITARGQSLQWGTLFEYNLVFGTHGNDAAPVVDTDPNLFSANVVAVDIAAARAALLYSGSNAPQRPSFAMPPTDLSRLRLVHGSCRKPHGMARDALQVLDEMIRLTVGQPLDRPHQLFLTGDQIYADDVADALLAVLTDAGDTLLGWNPPEMLPVVNKPARDLLPGRRGDIVKGGEAKMTSAEGKSHLFALSEFYAMYLFAWSDTLWPPTLPEAQDIYPQEYRQYEPAAEWARNPWGTRERPIPYASLFANFATERSRLQDFRTALPAVRRVLANIPSLMIFDDHEVTDDWYIYRKWCTDALGSALGSRIIQNALLAYAIFQAWGNTPEQFSPQGTTGERGRDLLSAASRWAGAPNSPDLQTIKTRVGVPDSATVSSTKRLDHPAGALDWHYSWPFVQGGPAYEVIVLDSRTWRGFPDGAKDPPRLISDAATIARQLPASSPPSTDGVTVVIAPAPVIGVHLVEHYIQGKAPTAFAAKVDAEAWTLQRETFEQLLATLFARNQRVVVLSGDVHYGFSAHLSYWATRHYGEPPPSQSVLHSGVLAQLTASALKNESTWPPTHLLHDMGFTTGSSLPPPQRLAGWNDRPTFWWYNSMALIPWRWERYHRDPAVMNIDKEFGSRYVAAQPDWRYQIDYIPSVPRVSPAGTQVSQPPAWTRETAMSAWISTLDNYEHYVKESAPGMEIVGWNNIGEVTFQWGTGDSKAVAHKLWWWLTPQAQPFPISRYTIQLGINDPQYPAPAPLRQRSQ